MRTKKSSPSFSRTILECKFCKKMFDYGASKTFSRTILECKYRKIFCECFLKQPSVEPYWNVNLAIGFYLINHTIPSVEPYWNVNLTVSIEMYSIEDLQ